MQNIETELITTEWYRPWNNDRSLISNLQRGRVRVLTTLFGEDVFSYCRKLSRGVVFSKAEKEEINKNFFKTYRQIHKLPRGTGSQDFYMQQNRAAFGLPQHYRELVPELASDWECKDELSDLSDRPLDLLRYLIGPADPVLTYEFQRHAVLIYQLGAINARTLNSRLQTVKSDVDRLLNKKLFTGPDGHGERISIRSLHDDETNEVVGFADHNDRIPLTAHVKNVPITVRQTHEAGEVHTYSRKKDDYAALIKTWIKALNNGGIIDINRAIQDSIGREYTLMDDRIPPDQFADLVVVKIEEEAGVESDLWEIPEIIRVENANGHDEDHGQSPVAPFKARRQIWFKDIPTPYELKVYDRETYLNALLEVGVRDPDTGIYNGRSHPLFNLRKKRKAVRVPFPQETYPVSDYDLNMAFVNKSKQIAYGLRNMHRAVW